MSWSSDRNPRATASGATPTSPVTSCSGRATGTALTRCRATTARRRRPWTCGGFSAAGRTPTRPPTRPPRSATVSIRDTSAARRSVSAAPEVPEEPSALRRELVEDFAGGGGERLHVLHRVRERQEGGLELGGRQHEAALEHPVKE